MTPAPEGTVRVKRDGPRGWHLIAKEKYDADPSAFEVYGEAPDAAGPAKQEDGGEIDRLRAEYAELTGQKPHHLWKAERLQSEIDKALAG